MTKGDVQINTFVGGMNMDADVSVLPDNSYRYAENVRVITNDAGTTGVLQNIEGFQQVTDNTIKNTEVVLGVTSIRDYAVVITRDGSYNAIYRYDFSTNKLVPTVTRVLLSDLGLTTELDIVINYEADDLIKIYFTDGNSPLKTLNIMDTKYIGNTSLTSKDFEILPKAYLPPMNILGLDSGTLYGGVIQYCYQLFNVNGTESTLSPLSALVHLTSSRTESNGKSYKGILANQNAGKSVKIKASDISTNFNKARIISIHYFDSKELPVISVVDEIDITSDSVYYEDRGSTILNELTVEQFNDMIGYDFIANNVEKLNNMLFASNIKENTWDVEYDARAYRCNESGVVKLLDNSTINPLSFNIADLTETTVPETHDCINPFNNTNLSTLPTSDDCQYVQISSGVFAKGGKGVNVSYRLITTDLIEDDSAIAGTTINGIPLFQNDLNLGISSRNASGLSIHKKLNDGTDTREFEAFTDIAHSRLLNYADPFIASKYKSYTRDEVYRFGLIMYNDKNIPSPVHWIADIRMPHASDDYYRPFTNNESIYSSINTSEGPYTLLSHPLGIQFSIANLPSEVKGVEIVRCERTVADKTVLMQGAVSKVGHYKHLSGKDGSDSAGDRDIRPYTYMTYGQHFGSKLYAKEKDWDDHYFDDGMRPPLSQAQSDSYYTFASPEVCVNRENTIPLLNDTMKLDILYGAASPTYSTYTSGGGSKQRIMSYAGTRFDDKNNLITLYPGDSQRIYGTVQEYTPDGSGGVVVPCVMYAADSSDTVIQYADTDDIMKAVNMGYVSKYYFLYRTANIVKKIGGAVGSVMATDLAKKTANVDKIEYANLLDYSDYVAIKNKPTIIGENIYFNWAHTNYANNKTEDRGAKEGPSGVSLVFKSEDLKNEVYGIASVLTSILDNGTVGKGYSTNSVLMVNLKKNIIPYGGNTYTARQNSVYISTGIYLKNTGTTLTANCFGGDTFLGVLDYARTMIFFNPEDPGQSAYKRIYVGAYLPVESSVNLHLRADTPISKSYDSGSGFANVFVQNEVGQVFTAAVQSVPMYAYNGAYSSQNGSRKYVPKSIYDRDDVVNDNRITASQVKTAGEVIDSWSKFKYADYIDVDSQYGPITNMHVFKDRLFFWQESAVGTAAVNERSLITDNNPGALVLGTGGILTRVDYVTDKNGSRKGDYNNITHSDAMIYWYDCNKNEICSYSGQTHALSKVKGVQSYLHTLPLISRVGSTVFYDKKYNEALFSFENKLLAFNEQLGVFTSFYTRPTDWAFDLKDAYYTIKDNKLYLHNTNNFDGVTSKLQIVVNKNYDNTKVFDNVFMSGDFTDNEVFTNIYFTTKVQETAPINYSNIDYREDTYRFAIGRSTDDNISRMRGKYLICDYSFDCTNDKSFRLPLIKTSYRYSMV